MVLPEGDKCFSVLVLLLAFTTQRQKKSKRRRSTDAMWAECPGHQGKETQHDDGEKNTSKPRKAKNPTKTKPQPNTTKGRRPIRAVRAGCTTRPTRSPSARSRSTLERWVPSATASSGKTWHLALTKVMRASSITIHYHPPVRNEEQRLSFQQAHKIIDGEGEIVPCLDFGAFGKHPRSGGGSPPLCD